MLTLRQSPFDLFERLEQQLATAERVPNAEIRETETSYTVQPVSYTHLRAHET